MPTSSHVSRLVSVLAFAVCDSEAVWAQGYSTGFVWNQADDYDAGVAAGSSVNNPNTDSLGAPVWSLETTLRSGTALTGGEPWYKLRGADVQRLVWDLSWFGGDPHWAFGNDLNPPTTAGSTTHTIANSSSAQWARVPLARWINPMTTPRAVSITGSLGLQWQGVSSVAANVDADVAIAHYVAATGQWQLLFGQRVEKPTDNRAVESVNGITVSVPHVVVRPGDELVFSHRGVSAADSAWITMVHDLDITLLTDAGDTNDDGVVDLADLNNVLNNFGETGPNPGDDNGDGTVDLVDLNAVLNNFGGGGPAASSLAHVPEPALSLSTLLMAAAIRRGRYRRGGRPDGVRN